MTTMTYGERLQAFAQGKRLRRFRGMLRNPRDTTCDACGSVMPNYLWGLRDMDTGAYYFVGQSCLAALSRMLVIERPFVRANIEKCYDEARGDGAAKRGSDGTTELGSSVGGSSPVHEGKHAGVPPNGSSGDMQVVENGEFVTVLVRAVSACGHHQAWGAASEPRYRQVWRLDPSGELVLKLTVEPNPDAVALCLARAQRMARQELEALAPTQAKAIASTA